MLRDNFRIHFWPWQVFNSTSLAQLAKDSFVSWQETGNTRECGTTNVGGLESCQRGLQSLDSNSNSWAPKLEVVRQDLSCAMEGLEGPERKLRDGSWTATATSHEDYDAASLYWPVVC